MTEQIKQKLKDVLIEHKNIASSEYDDEDAFVGIYFCDLVDIIDNIIHNIGWHTVSEPPKESGIYVVVTDFYSCQTATFAKYDKDKGWNTTDIDNIKWWCYPPKEE